MARLRRRVSRLPAEDRSFVVSWARLAAGGRVRWSSRPGSDLAALGAYREGKCLNGAERVILGPGSPDTELFATDFGFFHYGDSLELELIGPGPTLAGLCTFPGAPVVWYPSVQAVYKGVRDDAVGKGPGAMSPDSYPDGHITLDIRRYGSGMTVKGISVCGADSLLGPIGAEAWSTGLRPESWSLKAESGGRVLNKADGGVDFPLEPLMVIDLRFSEGQGIHSIRDLPVLVVTLLLSGGRSLKLGVRTEEGAVVSVPACSLEYVGMTHDRVSEEPGEPKPDGRPDGQLNLRVLRP